MSRFTADFETTTDINDIFVWAYGICEIGNENNFKYGNNIDDFISWCEKENKNHILYFHNLKFDGEFIFHYLLSNGFTFIKDKKDRKSKTFTTLISSLGQFYSIEVYFEVKGKRVNKVTFLDSMKLLNFSVDKISKAFNLEEEKLEINYHKKRRRNHTLTEDEIKYLKNDVVIMAKAMSYMFKERINKMTIGSSALANYKDTISYFNNYFPILDYEHDQDLRKSYKGGFTYLNPYYENKEVGRGIVLDVNSLYPSVMYNEFLPVGKPILFNGKYEYDVVHQLYIQMFSCSFELKEGKIPTIQIKNNMYYKGNEYLESTDGDIVTLTLTNIDLDLFFENYDVYDVVYHSGWKFKKIKGIFSNYIDYWTEAKINAKKEGNDPLYLISKLMLNSLYGKFGLNPNVKGKYPTINEDGVIKYKFLDEEIRDSIYVPVAAFITAYARKKTIETSQKIRDYSLKNYNEDYYIYSDTDSIHFKYIDIEEIKNIVDIDSYKLGYWDHEATFERAKFIRQKCYIEEFDGKIKVTIAGLPKKLHHKVNFKNFKLGFTTGGKLMYKHVAGGVMLADTEFTLK